jgi:hypothetical protein
MITLKKLKTTFYFFTTFQKSGAKYLAPPFPKVDFALAPPF